MQELFKGYVPTRNKECLMKFKNKTSEDLKSLREVSALEEYAGILNGNTILVDVDDYDQSEILMQIVEDLQLRCRVYETTRGKHFLFMNDERVKTNKTHAKLACGLSADIKLGSRSSYSILKYQNKNRAIIYDIFSDEEYQTVPKWLLPIATRLNFMDMKAGDGRNQSLFNYILTLQANDYSVEEARETIRIINKYVLDDPLSDDEIDTILRDESFQKPIFFKKNVFLFEKFATYVKNNNHVIKINGQLHIYQDGVYVSGNKAIEAEMIKHIPNLNKSKRAEVLAYLDLLVKDNSFMSDARYIAFKNGVLDLETEQMLDFSPAYIITNKIDVNYNPNAYSELMDKTLNKLACNDENIRALLEEVVGYCFYRRNELRKSFILTGGKRNGKSTYLDLINHLLDRKNISNLDLNELGDRFKTAELFGKLANIGDDIGDEFIANPAIFKKLVSGNPVNVEKKGADPFDFSNYAKFLFSANNIPRIKDKTGAVIDRLIIIPFDAVFDKNDPDYDPYIKYKLVQDEPMEYLVMLGVNGLKRVLANQSFTESEKIKKSLQEYEENNNPVLLFFKEIDETQVYNEPTKNVYMKYHEFCIANGCAPISNIEFSKRVIKHYDCEVVNKTIKSKKYRIFIKKGD